MNSEQVKGLEESCVGRCEDTDTTLERFEKTTEKSIWIVGNPKDNPTACRKKPPHQTPRNLASEFNISSF